MLPFEKEDVEILEKSGDKVDFSFQRENLIESGLINLDKPKGPTSTEVLNDIKKSLQIEKAGYAGTLDPNTTGVLPIGLGKGTKILTFFSLGGKKYRGNMCVHSKVEEDALREAIDKFTGKVKQLPPRKSSVKREERERKVYDVRILELKNKNVRFEIDCEHGFYVRKWCHNLGEHLGVGAHMTDLRRLQASSFKLENSVSLEEVKENYQRWLNTEEDKYLRKFILPVEEGVDFLPKVWVKNNAVTSIAHGAPVYAPGIVKLSSNIEEGRDVAIFNQEGRLIGVGKSKMGSEEIFSRNHGVAVKTHTVVIKLLNKKGENNL